MKSSSASRREERLSTVARSSMTFLVDLFNWLEVARTMVFSRSSGKFAMLRLAEQALILIEKLTLLKIGNLGVVISESIQFFEVSSALLVCRFWFATVKSRFSSCTADNCFTASSSRRFQREWIVCEIVENNWTDWRVESRRPRGKEKWIRDGHSTG